MGMQSLLRFSIKAPTASSDCDHAKPGLGRDRNKAFVIICWFVLRGFVSVFYWGMFLPRQTKPGENDKFSPSQIKLAMVTWTFPFQVSITPRMFLSEVRSDQLPMSGNDPDCSHTKNQVQSQRERAGLELELI